MWGAPGAAVWVITRLARFSALAFIIIPATVTGADNPPRDMDMEHMGMPALANSTWASMAPDSKESGAMGQLITEIKGLPVSIGCLLHNCSN